MTRKQIITRGAAPALLLALAAGCSTPSPTTSSYHPGPVVGRTVGTGVGVVAGNAAGLVVGTTEGVVQGMAAPFDNTTHVVRRWRTETTTDGRTIQVPEDILVDSKGRPVGPVSAPPPPPPPPPARP
jgi:hypothetical protein